MGLPFIDQHNQKIAFTVWCGPTPFVYILFCLDQVQPSFWRLSLSHPSWEWMVFHSYHSRSPLQYPFRLPAISILAIWSDDFDLSFAIHTIMISTPILLRFWLWFLRHSSRPTVHTRSGSFVGAGLKCVSKIYLWFCQTLPCQGSISCDAQKSAYHYRTLIHVPSTDNYQRCLFASFRILWIILPTSHWLPKTHVVFELY